MKLSADRRQNGRGSGERPHPEDAEACYAAAYSLVEAIDKDLQKGTRHYYNTAGRLLVSLDEVIQAILSDELVVDRPAPKGRGNEALQWNPVAEMSSAAQVAV